MCSTCARYNFVFILPGVRLIAPSSSWQSTPNKWYEKLNLLLVLIAGPLFTVTGCALRVTGWTSDQSEIPARHREPLHSTRAVRPWAHSRRAHGRGQARRAGAIRNRDHLSSVICSLASDTWNLTPFNSWNRLGPAIRANNKFNFSYHLFGVDCQEDEGAIKMLV